MLSQSEILYFSDINNPGHLYTRQGLADWIVAFFHQNDSRRPKNVVFSFSCISWNFVVYNFWVWFGHPWISIPKWFCFLYIYYIYLILVVILFVVPFYKFSWFDLFMPDIYGAHNTQKKQTILSQLLPFPTLVHQHCNEK